MKKCVELCRSNHAICKALLMALNCNANKEVCRCLMRACHGSCMDCHNELMEEELEVDLDQLAETFSLKDSQGVSRTFYVERRLGPNGIYLEAAENIEFGCKFAACMVPVTTRVLARFVE